MSTEKIVKPLTSAQKIKFSLSLAFMLIVGIGLVWFSFSSLHSGRIISPMNRYGPWIYRSTSSKSFWGAFIELTALTSFILFCVGQGIYNLQKRWRLK